MIKEITSKTILTKTKITSSWFPIDFNTNFYRGCLHGCIYCDSRSECYNIENFDDILVKVNAPKLMQQELAKKKIKGLIGTGSMSDPYLPIERKYRITRRCLEVIKDYNYPVFIMTKSDIILEDIDLLEKINKKTKVTVVFTLTTVNDEIASKIEPGAPLPSKRLIAMQELTKRGILTGVLLMPVLPFILDNENNILEVINSAKKFGATFIYPYFGVTLRDRQRTYYYDKLDKIWPNVKEKYQSFFGNSYSCNSKSTKELYLYFKNQCQINKLLYNMNDIANLMRYKTDNQLKFDIL